MNRIEKQPGKAFKDAASSEVSAESGSVIGGSVGWKTECEVSCKPNTSGGAEPAVEEYSCTCYSSSRLVVTIKVVVSEEQLPYYGEKSSIMVATFKTTLRKPL